MCFCRFFDPVSPSPLILIVFMDDHWAHVVPEAAVGNILNSSFHTLFDCLVFDLSLLAFANLANVRWKNVGHVKIFSIRFIKKQDLVDFLNPGFFIGCPVVVYNCFFVETGQASTHQHDVILHAVWKKGTWVTAGGFPDWGGVFRWPKTPPNTPTLQPTHQCTRTNTLGLSPIPDHFLCPTTVLLSVAHCFYFSASNSFR